MQAAEERAKLSIDARVAIINGAFDLPDKTPEVMSEVRKILAKAAEDLKVVLLAEKHDIGRVIATMDLLQQAKDTACTSLILPHYRK